MEETGRYILRPKKDAEVPMIARLYCETVGFESYMAADKDRIRVADEYKIHPDHLEVDIRR